MRFTTSAILVAFALSPAFAEDGMPAKVSALPTGEVLVDSQGMTLYTFDKDGTGQSACLGECAKAWPPLMVEGSSTPMGDWTLVARDDGGKQWAYKSKPLYTWIKDKKPGDVSGDGVNKVWHVATP